MRYSVVYILCTESTQSISTIYTDMLITYTYYKHIHYYIRTGFDSPPATLILPLLLLLSLSLTFCGVVEIINGISAAYDCCFESGDVVVVERGTGVTSGGVLVVAAVVYWRKNVPISKSGMPSYIHMNNSPCT